VHVVYGIVGLKTHCKVALAVRQEVNGVRCYAHVGTGNYHAQTSLLYTDLGLFTARPEFTEDVVHLFHYLTGRSLRWYYRKLLVAPIDMKASFLRMIAREIYHAQQGRGGRIVAKMNSLEDLPIIDALYEASRHGVQIDLIVRGFCCLRPGVKGVSENIRVLSTVGRFLEHSRVFYFGNGASSPEQGEFFLGSADWMYRNLNSRVEAVVPIEEASLKARCWEILNLYLSDRRQTWEMRSDGSYELRGGDDTGVQQKLLQQIRDRDSVLGGAARLAAADEQAAQAPIVALGEQLAPGLKARRRAKRDPKHP
jgi:polyphosphate kinase